MADKITKRGFHYITPTDKSIPIIRTGLATMGGKQGAKFGLIDPDSEGTTLLAKINGFFFGFFQAGATWGKNLGITEIEGISAKVVSAKASDTVHAEEYFLAALTDSWDLLTKDAIIKEDVEPSITIKITKTPCSGCAPQLVDFVKNRACSIRVKAAQLWGHKSNQSPHNITALDELGSAGVAVIPWSLLEKIGKKRKDLSQHELGDLNKEKFSMDDIARLHDEYKILRKALGLAKDDHLDQRLKDYKSRSLSKEAALAYSKQIASELVVDITGKLSKMETEAYDLQVKLEKAEIKPTRGSLRQKTKDLTKDSRAEARGKLIAQKERLDRDTEVLKKRKEFYSKLETGS